MRAWAATEEVRVETIKAYLFSIAPDAASSRHELESVMAALHAMPEIDRAAVLLRANDLSYEEIARTLAVSPAAARVKVHRARMKLPALKLRSGGN